MKRTRLVCLALLMLSTHLVVLSQHADSSSQVVKLKYYQAEVRGVGAWVMNVGGVIHQGQSNAQVVVGSKYSFGISDSVVLGFQKDFYAKEMGKDSYHVTSQRRSDSSYRAYLLERGPMIIRLQLRIHAIKDTLIDNRRKPGDDKVGIYTWNRELQGEWYYKEVDVVVYEGSISVPDYNMARPQNALAELSKKFLHWSAKWVEGAH
ncbi:MAG: hypothetical protein NTZ35_01315 [Ignavibacteriales bacterium]|nr:hypothetical protein [Ignavibacteriales bacterium]